MIPDTASLVHVNLRWGRDGARPISELAEAMQFSRRQVERAVEQLRAGGVPICTGLGGVWLTTDADELDAQVEALRRRAIHQLVNVRALRATARRFRRTQQMEMFG